MPLDVSWSNIWRILVSWNRYFKPKEVHKKITFTNSYVVHQLFIFYSMATSTMKMFYIWNTKDFMTTTQNKKTSSFLQHYNYMRKESLASSSPLKGVDPFPPAMLMPSPCPGSLKMCMVSSSSCSATTICRVAEEMDMVSFSGGLKQACKIEGKNSKSNRFKWPKIGVILKSTEYPKPRIVRSNDNKDAV